MDPIEREAIRLEMEEEKRSDFQEEDWKESNPAHEDKDDIEWECPACLWSGFTNRERQIVKYLFPFHQNGLSASQDHPIPHRWAEGYVPRLLQLCDVIGTTIGQDEVREDAMHALSVLKHAVIITLGRDPIKERRELRKIELDRARNSDPVKRADRSRYERQRRAAKRNNENNQHNLG